jgi:hypothetical protein
MPFGFNTKDAQIRTTVRQINIQAAFETIHNRALIHKKPLICIIAVLYTAPKK